MKNKDGGKWINTQLSTLCWDDFFYFNAICCHHRSPNLFIVRLSFIHCSFIVCSFIICSFIVCSCMVCSFIVCSLSFVHSLFVHLLLFIYCSFIIVCSSLFVPHYRLLFIVWSFVHCCLFVHCMVVQCLFAVCLSFVHCSFIVPSFIVYSYIVCSFIVCVFIIVYLCKDKGQGSAVCHIWVLTTWYCWLWPGTTLKDLDLHYMYIKCLDNTFILYIYSI